MAVTIGMCLKAAAIVGVAAVASTSLFPAPDGPQLAAVQPRPSPVVMVLAAPEATRPAAAVASAEPVLGGSGKAVQPAVLQR